MPSAVAAIFEEAWAAGVDQGGGPDASEETIEAFVARRRGARSGRVRGGMRERELFKKALAKQVICNQSERRFRRDSLERRRGDERWVLRALSCEGVRGDEARAPATSAGHIEARVCQDPMSVLRPSDAIHASTTMHTAPHQRFGSVRWI